MSMERKSEASLGRRGPRQNRVDPFGELHAVAARGAMMGNRGGRLHSDDRTLGARRWTNKHWLICRCEFNDRWREVWAKGKGYTELFFLDEPTALAAGHRPCFQCRFEAATAFLAVFPKGAWSSGRFGVNEMDNVLHRERLADRRKRLWRSRLEALPDGAMVVWDGRPHAVRNGSLAPWNFEGYGAPLTIGPTVEADVLTPPSTVAALAGGYRPEW
jgi:hypothetical protein